MINCVILVNQIFIWHNSSIKREIRNMYVSSSLYRSCVPADLDCQLMSFGMTMEANICVPVGEFLDWDN